MRLLFFPTFRNNYIVFPCSEYFWKTAEVYIPCHSFHKTPRKSAGLQRPAIAWLLCLQPAAFSHLLGSCRTLHPCVSRAAPPDPCAQHRPRRARPPPGADQGAAAAAPAARPLTSARPPGHGFTPRERTGFCILSFIETGTVSWHDTQAQGKRGTTVIFGFNILGLCFSQSL